MRCSLPGPACRAGAALRGARKQEAKPFSKPLVCPVRSWEGQGALGLLQLLVLKGESALPWEHQATSFLTGEFQAGSDAISWRQAGLVGPPGSDSGDKHLSAHSSLSQCPPAPVPLQHFLGAFPGLLQRQLLGAWVLVGGTAGSLSALTSRESPA